jgi:hypothetical protein
MSHSLAKCFPQVLLIADLPPSGRTDPFKALLTDGTKIGLRNPGRQSLQADRQLISFFPPSAGRAFFRPAAVRSTIALQ